MTGNDGDIRAVEYYYQLAAFRYRLLCRFDRCHFRRRSPDPLNKRSVVDPQRNDLLLAC